MNHEDVLKRLPYVSQAVRDYYSKTDGIARLFTQMIIGNLPDTDLNISVEAIQDTVEHSAWLYDIKRWGDIPLDLFLNFVVHPRCSKEKVEACRTFFYREVEHLLTHDLTQTVLNINYWCAGQVKYQLTDPRTKSALFSYLSASGRCGEKATFLVQVFRSVGIPARVAYVPLWEHIDDNHAWVEVYLDGTWRYMGAGEGEEILEKAWFTLATTRAPYILSNAATFLDDQLNVLQRGKLWKNIDHTSHYRPVKTVRVTTALPLESLDCVILNTGSFRPVNTIFFDDNQAQFSYGGGDVFLKGVYDGTVILKPVLADETTVHIDQHDVVSCKRAFTQTPAPAGEIRVYHETEAMVHAKEKKRHEAAVHYQEKYERIRTAGMHHEAIARFRELVGVDADAVLSVMKPKDLLDFDPELYAAHFNCVSQYRTAMDDALFMNAVATPRVHWEELTPYATQFYAAFNGKKAWRNQPSKIYEWAIKTIHTDSMYAIPGTYMPINRMLEYPYGSEMDINILVVSIARVLGIPARYQPEKDDIEYYDGTQFVSFKSSKPRYTLRIEGDFDSMCVSVNPLPMPASFNEHLVQGEAGVFEDDYTEGLYEIAASKRLPSGTVVGTLDVVRLKEDACVTIQDIDVTVDDIVENVPIADCLDEAGIGSTGILIVGDPLEEPTAHALNELYERRQFINEVQIPVTFVNRNPHHFSVLLEDVKTAMPMFVTYDTLEMKIEEKLARRVFREPRSYPLVIIMKEGYSKISTSGYHVNSIDNPWLQEILGGMQHGDNDCDMAHGKRRA